MSSAPQQQPSARDELLVKLDRRTKWLLFIVLTLILLFVVSVISGLLLFRWKLMAIEKAQRDLEFGQFVSDYNNGQDFVQPDVNMIQFLRHGYSITFDKVEYTQNGLALTGQVGNPTQFACPEFQCSSISLQDTRQVGQGAGVGAELFSLVEC